MQTFKQIKELNYNDISLFLGIPVIDAKYLIESKIFPLSREVREIAKIGINDCIGIKLVEKPIHSNSDLDGKGTIETIVNMYNKCIPPSKMIEFAHSKTFINAVKFTGKHTIINKILNPEQLLKLQKICLFANIYGKKRWSKNAAVFIRTNSWAKDYLEFKGIQNIYQEVSDTLDTKEELTNA